jgi:hypothetical protein
MNDTKPIEFDGLGISSVLGQEGFDAWKKFQQELLEFMGRRAQASAKWPSDFSRCRSPQDVWHEQMRFMKEMVSDCEASGQRIFVALASSRSNGEAISPKSSMAQLS